MKYQELLDRMSLSEKIALCSGADFWNTKAFKRYDIPSIRFSDGPHGLRKQDQENDPLGIHNSKPATCFPAASSLGCSWDIGLVEEVSTAIAREAHQENIAVVLGPGINIKRNPLCGRNFEYFSEDPYLTGALAAAYIRGLENNGIAASVKHFVANNQETLRFSSDSIVDERTLREIYLTAFEIAIKEGHPSTVMCAYNKVNGIHCSDHGVLLRDILRKEWGFEGVVLTDWGAMNDRAAAFKAGTDLEMPGGAGYFDQEVLRAVQTGSLPEAYIDESANRLLTLIFKAASCIKPQAVFDFEDHHRLARRAAAESAVLLKNEDDLLPLAPDTPIAVFGSFAENIRFQGAGSSRINPTAVTHVLPALDAQHIVYSHHKVCAADGTIDEHELENAVQSPQDCETAVMFAGLPEEYESEGFDRETMEMPTEHIRMILEVSKRYARTVVILLGGSPVEMPWIDRVGAVLHMYLPGQAGGEAATDLLFGLVNPSGKLAESYPFIYRDVPSAGIFENGGVQAQYREALFVGYRYYDTACIPVRFPFGFGLSYTTFSYLEMRVVEQNDKVIVHVRIKNTGQLQGAEVVQLYVRDLQKGVRRPDKELKGFVKLLLQPGEEGWAVFELTERAFAYYDASFKGWQTQTGIYHVLIGSSSQDIRLSQSITRKGSIAPKPQEREPKLWYDHFQGKPRQEDLEALLDSTVSPAISPQHGNFTTAHSVMDMQDSWIMRLMYKLIEKNNAKAFGGADYSNPAFKLVMRASTEIPFKNMVIVSGGMMPRKVAEGLVHMANGRYIKGLLTMLRKIGDLHYAKIMKAPGEIAGQTNRLEQ